MQETIMKFERTLPPDFDGTFRFTNPSKEDFIGKWGGKEYLFPAESTTPMIIVEHSPLEIQNIRKKFAKDLAEREFYKSKAYKGLAAQEGSMGNRNFSSFQQAATYTLSDLEPYIQECLKPLKAGEIMSRPAEKSHLEDKLKRDDNGALISEVVELKKDSLKQKALNA
jgi:hypothetical protein